MSQPDSLGNPGGIYEERPRSNVYTAMLGVSLVALILASAMLGVELSKYKWDYKGDAVKAVQLRAPVAAPPRGVLPAAAVDDTSGDAATPAAPVATPSVPAAPAATPSAPAATPSVPAVPAINPVVPGAPTATGATPAVPAATPAATPAP